jgi:hypothetical protein
VGGAGVGVGIAWGVGAGVGAGVGEGAIGVGVEAITALGVVGEAGPELPPHADTAVTATRNSKKRADLMMWSLLPFGCNPDPWGYLPVKTCGRTRHLSVPGMHRRSQVTRICEAGH